MRDGFVDFLHFCGGKIPPFAHGQVIQCHIHDPDAFQLVHIIAQVFTHPADLAIETLCQNNSEYKTALFPHEAFFSNNP